MNIVFAVCHPDDEAIWCGGMLYEFSRFSSIKTHVICLSGRDPGSQREAEFNAAKKIAGYTQGVVLGFPLRKALEPLPDVAVTFEEGLSAIGLKPGDVDLLITHSPYGDEHMHPHHSQTHFGIKRWAKRNRTPFGFFSCLPLPSLKQKSLLRQTWRKGTFQFLSFDRCYQSPSWLYYFFGLFSWQMKTRPAFFLRFLTRLDVKIKMLECYQSVDPVLFEKGYATYNNPCEGLYVDSASGLRPFREMMLQMTDPEWPVLFGPPHFLLRVKNKLKKLKLL